MKKAKLLPPTYFIIYLSLAIGLHFVLPVTKLVHAPYNYIGILLIGVGIWLNIRADQLFKRRNTTVKPFEQSTCFIEEGPFAFSRHPMYLGMVVILVGVAVLLGNIVSLFAALGFFVTMDIAFVRHEEKALEETFGEEFLDYKKRVRRWL